MPVREATEEEVEALRERSSRMERPSVRPATPDEVAGLKQERQGIMTRIIKRAMGTDVQDPAELERLGTVLVGGIGGGAVGARTPTVPGPAGVVVNPITGAIAGSIAGATAGAALPEQTMEAMESMGILPPGYREEHGLSGDEYRRVVEGEALLELATMGAVGATRAGGRVVSRALTRPGREGAEAAEKAAQQGIDMAPFQLRDRGLGRGIVNVFGRFPIVGGSARKLGKAQDEIFRRIASDTSFRIGPLLSNSSLGVRVWEDARNTLQATQRHFSDQYDELFLRANRAGVNVDPQNSLMAAQSTLETLLERAPRTASGEPGTLSRAGETAKQFINDNVLGEDSIGAMSLAQMDEFISKVDQEIASAPQEIRGEVSKLLSPIKGAAKSDIEQNLFVREGGDEAAIFEIKGRLAEVDAEFSQVMREVFETTAAKRISRVQRKGLRGTARVSEQATQVPIDRLAPIVTDLNSPQVIDELSRLVSQDTMRGLASRTVADAFEQAVKETANGDTILRSDVLSKQFGLEGADKGRREAMERLLRDTPLTMDDLSTIVESARMVEQSPVPNASTFMARRAAIGGTQATIRGLLPFMAMSGAGGGVGGGMGAAIGGLLFMGGARTLTSAVSNPDNARAIKAIMDKEAKTFVRRAAWVKLARSGLNGAQEAGQMAAEHAEALSENLVDISKQLFPEDQQQQDQQ